MLGQPPEIRKRPASILDLIELGDAFDQIGTELSERFLDAVEATIARLAKRPGVGAPWEDEKSGVLGVRCSTVDRFRKYLILYRETQSGLEILRIVPATGNLRHVTGLETVGDEVTEP